MDRRQFSASHYPLPGFINTNGVVAVNTLDDVAIAPVPASPGALVFSTYVEDYFYFDKDSGQPIDGTWVLGSVHGGNARMIRVGAKSPRWTAQAAWYIDPINGDNSNPGTLAEPIKTHDELEARLAQIAQDTTVEYLSAAPPTERARLNLVVKRQSSEAFIVPLLTYRGPAAVAATGTFTTVAGPVRTGGTPSATKVTCNTIADFTPYIGKKLVVTSGAAAGTYMWIGAAAAANTATGSAFFDATQLGPATVLPAPGDSFAVHTPYAMPVLSVYGTCAVICENVQLHTGSDFGNIGGALFLGCDVHDVVFNNDKLFAAYGCYFPLVPFSAGGAAQNNTFLAVGCLFRGNTSFIANESTFVEIVHSVFQGSGAGTAIGLGNQDPGGILALTDVGFFGWDIAVDASGASNLNLNNGPYATTFPSLWGAANQYGIRLNACCTVQHGTIGATPNIISGTTPLRIGAANHVWADLPIADLTTGVRAVMFTPL